MESRDHTTKAEHLITLESLFLRCCYKETLFFLVFSHTFCIILTHVSFLVCFIISILELFLDHVLAAADDALCFELLILFLLPSFFIMMRYGRW